MGTRCHELAKYVIYDSPLQMLSDAPPHYRKEPKTMDFLKEVPTVWDESIALDGRIGEFAVMARRSGDRWFLGGLTTFSAFSLDALGLWLRGQERIAVVYVLANVLLSLGAAVSAFALARKLL